MYDDAYVQIHYRREACNAMLYHGMKSTLDDREFRSDLHLWNRTCGNKAQPSHADPSVRLPSTSPLCGVGKYGIEIKKPMTACFPELGK
jgi:hypothetical protein